MLNALLKGETKSEEIAQFAQGRAKKRIPEIMATLEGHPMSQQHRKMIRYSLAHMRFLEEQLEELDGDIIKKIGAAGLVKEWQLLQTVPGIQERSAAKILAETGPDRTQFPSERDQFVGRSLSGKQPQRGQEQSSRTTGGNPWLGGALTECAWAAPDGRNDCILAKSGRSKVEMPTDRCNELLIVLDAGPWF
jgi:transposase